MMKRIVMLVSLLAVVAAGIATAVVINRARVNRPAAVTGSEPETGTSGTGSSAPSGPSGSSPAPRGILPSEQDGPIKLSDAAQKDSDGDGLIDGEERELGTNPMRKDSDGDGLDDREEVRSYCTNPLKAMTDGKTQDRAWIEAREQEAVVAGQRASFCVE